MQFIVAQGFESADGGMDGGVRGARVAAAIPSAVGHLLLEQVAGYRVDASVFILEWERMERTMPVTQVSLRRVHFAQMP